jgi:CRISPR-associated endonuclease Csy4
MSRSYFYQEITCLPDHEISVGFVIGKVMNILHLALVGVSQNGKTCPVGISFPGYLLPGEKSGEEDSTFPLGNKIRLVALNEADLVGLELSIKLARLSDYVHISSVRVLQRQVKKYMIYKRFQPKGSKERLIRRQMKRKGKTEEEIISNYANLDLRPCDLPFINIRSHSTGENFRLFIDRIECEKPTSEWVFSTYGLSSQASVPHF